MKALALKIRTSADEDGDFEAVAAMEDYIGQYNKNLWFLTAMQK